MGSGIALSSVEDDQFNGIFNSTTDFVNSSTGNVGIGYRNQSDLNLQLFYRFDDQENNLVLGEAGRFTVSDGNWKNISFQNSYDDPVVIGTTNTHNGEPAIVFEARNVSSTWAEMRLCESEGGSNSGCDSHVAEEAGYLIVDSSKVGEVPGIDAGTFTDDGGIDTVKSVSYSESFSSNPYVFTSVQTDNGLSPVESRVTTRSTSGFDGAICHTASADACNTSHVPEDVGYLAINPGNIPFAGMEMGGQTGISDSNWASDTFTETFTQTPVALAENPTESGGQELQIDEVRSVTQTGLEFRYCEIEPTDTCDTHTGETVHWLAVEPGDLLYSTVVDSSSQGRDSDNGQFDIQGDGVMSSNSYSFNGLDQRILLEPFTFFEEAFTTRSYSTWINPDEVNDPQVIFEEGGTSNGLNIYIKNSKIFYGAWSEDDGYQGDWISTSIQADKWQHVAFSFSDSNMSAYLDGNYIGSVNPGSSIATHGGTSAIGAMQGDTKTDTGDQSGDSYYFNGSIDEFRVFGEAITPQDVQKEYFYGKDGVFEGDYSSGTSFDTVDPQNWEKIEVDTTMTANTELSAKIERINSSGAVRAIDTFELSDGSNSFNIEGLPYTTGYRLNFSGNTTDPTETWKLNSYNVIGKDEPNGPKVSLNQPLIDSTPVNNVTFDFTPKCYSDLGCDTAELFFNYTQNFTENVVTDTTDDFQQGSFTNTSSRQGSVKLKGLKVASGNFQSTTGDVTVNDVGFEPDVIEFIVTNTNPTFDTTTTRGGEPYGFGHGFADCTGTNCNQVSFTQASGSASTNGAFAASSDQYSILMGDTGNDGTGGSIGIQGNVSSTGTDGFTVTFDTDTIGNQVTYRAYKTRGDVDVGSFNTPTSNGQQSISTGFQGDYLNVITQPQLTSMNTQNNFAGSDTGWSHGYATDTGSSEQVAMGVSQYQSNIDDHVFTSSSGQVIDLLEAKSKGGITGRVDASLSSFNTNGFTLDYSNTASGQPAIYLAMDTGGSAEAGYETTPSSTGDQVINTDLNPDHVNFVASNTVSGIDVEGFSGANGAENHWGWMFGSGNTTDQRSMGFSSHSNSVNGHASGSSASDIFQLLYSDQDGNILGQDKATLSSTAPGSFTMNWNSITTSTTTDVKYDQILYSYVTFSDGLKTEGSYESETFKAQKPVYWNNSAVTSSTPSGTSLDLEYGENSSGSYQFYNSISNVPRSSYLKYRADLSTTNPENTPSLEKVNITYLRPESWNVRDSINSVSNNTQQQFEYNFSTIFDLPQEIKWNVRVNQSDGKTNYSDNNLTAIIADNPPNSPLWRNQSQEKDTVPKSGTNELRSQGFDSVRLKNASLLTGIYDPGYWMAGTAQPRITNYIGQWNDLTGKASAPSNSILSMTAQRQNVFIGSSNSEFTVWNTSNFKRFGQSTTPFSSKIYALSSNSTSVFIGTSGPDLSLFNINDQSFRSLGSPPDSCKVLDSISTYSNNGFGDFFAYGTGCGNIYRYNGASTTDITPASIFSGKVQAFASNDTHIIAADTKGNIALYNGDSWNDITSKFGFFTNGRSINTISSGDLENSDPSFFLIGGGSGRLEKLYANGTSVEVTSDLPGSWTILSSDHKESEKIFRLGGTSGNLYRYNSTGFFEDKPTSFSNAVEAITSTEDNIKSESMFSTKQYSADSRYVWSNFTWVNSSVEDQSIGWRIKYTDSNGKSGFTPIKSFFVSNTDTAPPIITIDSPANTSLDISDIPLEVSASETVDQWKYNLDNSGNQSFTPDTTLNTVSEGTHSIKVWANDTSGNYGRRERDFTVDLTKPTVSNIQDNATSDFFQIDTANISLGASDSLSGLNKIKLATDETGSFENKTIYGSPKTLSNISGETITESFQWRNESFSGTLNYKYWVRDAAGNWRETNSNSFNIQPLEQYLFANLTARDWDKGNNDDMVVREQGLGIGLEETAKNLQEYYLFEEFSASALKDRSSGIETRSSGGITTDQSGILNSQTYSFDGTDDYIAVNRSYDTSEDIKEVSVCSWAKSSTNKGQIIMSYDRSEFWRFSLSSAQGANGFVGWQTEGADMNGNTKVTDGNWHHICAVFDSSVTNEKKIYVDGQLDAEADQFSTGTGFGTADGSETETYGFIGTGSEASSFDGSRGPGQYLEGKIDSLQVFNRSLSQTEIQELAVSNPPRKGSHIRDFDVPGYQEPVILESTSSGLGADTEFRLSGSNQNGEELFIDSSSGSKNFSLSVGQDNKFSLNVNGSTSNKLKSPIMNSLTIWMDSKMYSSTVSAVNETGNVKDNAEVSFFNRFDDVLSEAQLSSSQTDTEERIPRMENYSVKIDAPTGYSFQEVRVNQIESDTDKNLDFQMISNYSGTSIPDTATDRYYSDPVIAFDDSSTNYKDAELVLPYTNSAVDKIAHCTDWDFTNRECSSSTDWDLNDPSFYNAELNGTHAIFSVSNFDAYATVKESQKFPNLKVNEVTINNTEPVSGDSVEITANISNNESVSASPKINLSVISYNGTDWIYEKNQSTNANVDGNSFDLIDFVISSNPGRYRFKVTADPDDSIGETSESDNSNFTELNFSSHQVFYGSTSESVNLADEEDKSIKSWVSDEAGGTLYFTDSDVSFAASDLMPLNNTGDLGEADGALNLNGHNDSLSNLFDGDGDGSADKTGCVLVSGSGLCDVPLINSTDSSSFRTGVLYDSSMGSSFDGSQNLIFATEINSSKTGKFGIYDYEVKVPYSLGRQEPTKQELKIYQEIG